MRISTSEMVGDKMKLNKKGKFTKQIGLLGIAASTPH